MPGCYERRAHRSIGIQVYRNFRQPKDREGAAMRGVSPLHRSQKPVSEVDWLSGLRHWWSYKKAGLDLPWHQKAVNNDE